MYTPRIFCSPQLQELVNEKHLAQMWHPHRAMTPYPYHHPPTMCVGVRMHPVETIFHSAKEVALVCSKITPRMGIASCDGRVRGGQGGPRSLSVATDKFSLKGVGVSVHMQYGCPTAVAAAAAYSRTNEGQSSATETSSPRGR